MQLATDTTDFASGALGLVELALSHLNDRKKRLFSKSEMVEYSNHAQNKLASIINRFRKEYFLTFATATTVADQSYYALPADLVHIFGIDVRDTPTDTEHQRLVEVEFNAKDFYERLDKANDANQHGFFFVAGTTFKVLPASSGGGEEIRVHYIKRLTPLAANADVSEIPLEYHALLSLEMARYGYIKLNRRNVHLNEMWKEGLEAMSMAIRQYSPLRDRRTVPFYGTYGPTPDMTGRIHGRAG